MPNCCYANGKNRRGWSHPQARRYILLFNLIFKELLINSLRVIPAHAGIQ